MRDILTGQIEAFILPCIEELSVELIDLKVKHRGKTVVVDIVADRPNGGITIDECTYINKKVDRIIGKRQWFGEDYTVEVSSPGLDRALRTSKDFARVLGRQVRFHLLEPIEGKIEHLGEVMEVKENQVLIKKNDVTITIPLKHISKAVQVIK